MKEDEKPDLCKDYINTSNPCGSGRPTQPLLRDVWQQTHQNIPFRLAMGFALLRKSGDDNGNR